MTTPTEITIGNWQTRDGRKARVVCVDRMGEYPVIALLLNEDQTYESSLTFTRRGEYCPSNDSHSYDLIAPWVDKPVFDPSTFPKWRWAAMDEDGKWSAYTHKPKQYGTFWSNEDGQEHVCILGPKEPFTGDWKDSLTELPA